MNEECKKVRYCEVLISGKGGKESSCWPSAYREIEYESIWINENQNDTRLKMSS